MKRYILALLLMPLLAACDSQLDITPKGKVTLGKVAELELLLNQEYNLEVLPALDLGVLAGESLGMFNQVSTVLAQTNTVRYALMAFDEQVDRATLTTTDDRYAALYKYINYMNTIVEKMPQAEGDAAAKPRLVAEARVMRAYLHWLVACIHAPQYDPATAATDGGIAYVTATDVLQQKQKLNLEDTYRMILEDVTDDIIADLPQDHGTNVMRGDRAWGNAVRAVVLTQMKRYAEALPYALEAIRLRPQLFDRAIVKSTGQWTQDRSSENNILYIGAGIRVCPTSEMLTLETNDLFEPGDYVRTYDKPDGWSLSYGESYSGISGVLMYMGWGAQGNPYGLTAELLHYVAAECLIRTGKTAEGLELVDRIRQLRVENAAPLAAASEAEAMALLQRAKWIECLGTAFNFIDVKRWNSESAYARTVSHRLGTQGTFRLSPTSPLWIFPFPRNAVRYNPSLTQTYQQ